MLISNFYFETIAFYNGKFLNIEQHQARINKCLEFLAEQGYSCQTINLSKELENILNNVELSTLNLQADRIYRFRMDYNNQEIIYHEPIFNLYTPRQVSQYVLWDIDFSYKHKGAERLAIQSVQQQLTPEQEVIFCKDNFITDTSIGNLLFFTQDKIYTPDTFLLAGTHRAKLLEAGIIECTSIKTEDIYSYTSLLNINALNTHLLTREDYRKLSIAITKESVIKKV